MVEGLQQLQQPVNNRQVLKDILVDARSRAFKKHQRFSNFCFVNSPKKSLLLSFSRLDLKRSDILYAAGLPEYFLYDFEKLSVKGKAAHDGLLALTGTNKTCISLDFRTKVN